MAPRLIDRLRSARQVLAGLDENGVRVHPGMFDPQVISLAHGDGVRRPPDAAVAAGIAALLDTENASLDDYLFLQRHEELEAAITEDFAGAGIPADTAANVSVDSGTTRLFAGFLRVATEPGDLLGVPRSYYHPLPSWCELHRVDLDLIPTDREADYKLTAGLLEDWCGLHRSRPPRAIFLFNPTQTGALYTADELISIAEVVQRSGMLVLEDSVFAGTEFPGQQRVCHLAAAAPSIADRVVTLKGASKAYNLANIRIGWACGPGDLMKGIYDHTVTTSVTIPSLTKAMALAAFRAPVGYLEENARECSERAALITDLVEECNDVIGQVADQPVLTVSHKPQAGHAILIAAPGLMGRRLPDGSTVRASTDVTRFLLSTANVATSPGYSLGFDGTELRLAFGSVGLKQTYPSSAARELGSAMAQLAVFCDKAAPEMADRVREVSDLLHKNATQTAPEPFQAGRELIRTAFRERIAMALRDLLRCDAGMD